MRFPRETTCKSDGLVPESRRGPRGARRITDPRPSNNSLSPPRSKQLQATCHELRGFYERRHRLGCGGARRRGSILNSANEGAPHADWPMIALAVNDCRASRASRAGRARPRVHSRCPGRGGARLITTASSGWAASLRPAARRRVGRPARSAQLRAAGCLLRVSRALAASHALRGHCR